MTAQIIQFIPKPNPKLIEAKVIEMGPMIELKEPNEFRADHDWPDEQTDKDSE